VKSAKSWAVLDSRTGVCRALSAYFLAFLLRLTRAARRRLHTRILLVWLHARAYPDASQRRADTPCFSPDPVGGLAFVVCRPACDLLARPLTTLFRIRRSSIALTSCVAATCRRSCAQFRIFSARSTPTCSAGPHRRHRRYIDSDPSPFVRPTFKGCNRASDGDVLERVGVTAALRRTRKVWTSRRSTRRSDAHCARAHNVERYV
jgi:hypothetical protein